MGRNKIKIEKIKSERNRNITFIKRKKGLIKKAMELSLLCDAEILVAIVSKDNEQLSLFCSDESVENFSLKYLKSPINTNNLVSLKDVYDFFKLFQYSSLFSELPQKKNISKNENFIKLTKEDIQFKKENFYPIENNNKIQNIPFSYNQNFFPFNYYPISNFGLDSYYKYLNNQNLNFFVNQNLIGNNELNKNINIDNLFNNQKDKNFINDSPIVNNINMNIGNINNYLNGGENSKNFSNI